VLRAGSVWGSNSKTLSQREIEKKRAIEAIDGFCFVVTACWLVCKSRQLCSESQSCGRRRRDDQTKQAQLRWAKLSAIKTKLAL
jgi:hypothetical protein